MKIQSNYKILILIFLIFFPIGFILNAPIENTLNSLINTNAPKACKSSIPKLSLSYLPVPHLKAEKFNLYRQCSSLKNDTYIKKIEVITRGLSFSPFGLKFKINIELNNKESITLFTSLNHNSQKILLDQTEIPSSIINSIAKNPISLRGSVTIDMIARFTKAKIEELKFNISSKALTFPEQNISGFTVPDLKLTPLILEGKLKSKDTFSLDTVEVGNNKSSLQFKGKGSINNFSNMRRGTLTFLGKLSLLGEIKKQFSFLELVMGPPNNDGSHEFEVNGPLQSLKFKPINK